MIEESAEGDAEKAAVFVVDSSREQARFLVHQLTVQAMFNHGLFGSGAPPDKTHPWSSLTGVEPGEDPRSASNNFLKEDGKTLMSLQEMLAGDGSRFNAYRRWLYKRPEDNPWKSLRVESELDRGFNDGFKWYQ